MALSQSRVVLVGETPHPHEAEAIAFAREALPDSDPYQLWALLELLDPASGALYEIDLLILGYSALYLVEVKSGPGLYEGDTVDWYRTPKGEHRRYMDPPFRLANHKAKVLKTRLQQQMREHRAPRVEALVFLSNEDVQLDFRNYGDTNVVTRKTFRDAVIHHQFPGRTKDWRAPRISVPVARDVAQALRALGIRPRAGKSHAGSYELGEVLIEGVGFQDRAATHRDMRTVRARARTYLVPQQTSVERRQRLHRAADREFQLLDELKEHPDILRAREYVVDAPLGPTVVFDEFPGGIQLDAFLRANPKLSFDDRIEIISQLSRALSFCHKKAITHGALSPHAVLVRRGPEDKIETRLFNFQLAGSDRVQATTHWSALADDPWTVYQAPEVRENPGRRSSISDVFSLGAVAYHVLTGQAPATDAASADERLRGEGKFDPRAVADDLKDEVADVIGLATARSPIERADDVGEWLILLLDVLTAPEADARPVVDPLQAGKDDVLDGNLLVIRQLGEGASSRVLEVERDGRRYALKVSLDASHDERLDAEASVLEKFESAPVVRLVDPPMTIAGRRCLLLTLAGDQTLRAALLREGPVSLDYAGRYGEDLLRALEHLEELRVTHRDIKPANLGVGTATKRRNHLTLFDFSMASTPATEVGVGTAAYRDPFLADRGRWDDGADRWSAAVTLHEMLTGARPSFVNESGVEALAKDPGAHIAIAAERFDPAVRERLNAFFTRALASDFEKRFISATEMRREWERCFEEPKRSLTPAPAAPSAATSGIATELGDADVARITPQTPIGALPLSNRARNALDRAGLTCAGDLHSLPDNRLSAVRGVGTEVAREILKFRERWAPLHAASAAASAPFFPAYRGDDLLITTAGLPTDVATALRDAGLHTLAVVARAPQSQVAELAKRQGFDVAKLSKLLDAENRRANERQHPTTLEGWVQALQPKQKGRRDVVDRLFGLVAPFDGRLDVSVREVAADKGVTQPAVYIQLGKTREDWAKHGALPELAHLVQSVVSAAGGATPLDRAAAALTELIPYDESEPLERTHARAGSLVRVVADVQRDDPSGLRLLRIHDSPWLFASEAHADAVRALGRAADELAARDQVAAAGEAGRVLAEVVAETPLAAIGAERLIDLAAAASKSAARSARMEIYPRGMSAERALDLTTPVLSGAMTEAQLRQRVSARYPDAAPLPERPPLDALLEPLGLLWNPDERCYQRPGTRFGTVLRTSTGGISLTTLPVRERAIEAAEVAERELSERLKDAVERRAFRVLSVTTDLAPAAALALADAIRAPVVEFDRKLIKQMKTQGVDEELIHSADREGPTGAAWRNLRSLAEKSAEQVAAELLPPQSPLLLIQPGLIARYHLTNFLEALLAASKRDESAAIFLLVPGRDTSGVPAINGELSIPGVLPSHALRISHTWLAKRIDESTSAA
ncbi:MAG: BREX system serine/threonine kinase PglW [Polyangiaceae bacterium]